MIRDEIARWTHGEDWRTWVAHSVLGLVLALVSSLLLGWDDGWKIAIGFYFWREIDQVFYMVVGRKQLHPFDHLMDVAAPAVTLIIVVALAHWLV